MRPHIEVESIQHGEGRIQWHASPQQPFQNLLQIDRRYQPIADVLSHDIGPRLIAQQCQDCRGVEDDGRHALSLAFAQSFGSSLSEKIFDGKIVRGMLSVEFLSALDALSH
jgi:hypothetical protein